MIYYNLVDSMIYKLKNAGNKFCLDMRSKGQIYTNTPNDSDHQKWKATRVDNDKTGWFYIECVKTNKVIDSNKGAVYSNKPSYNNGYQSWIIEPSVNQDYQGFVLLKNKNTSQYLTVSDGAVITLDDAKYPDSYWTIELLETLLQTYPDSAKLNVLSISGGSETEVLVEDIQRNNGVSIITKEFTLTASTSDTVMYSLTETLGVDVSLTVSGGIPGVMEAESTITMTLDLSSTQEKTWQKSKEITIKEGVQIPPYTIYARKGKITLVKDATIPFEVLIDIKALTGENYLGAEKVDDIMRSLSPINEWEVDYNSDGVRARFKGKMTSDFAIKSYYVDSTVPEKIEFIPYEVERGGLVTIEPVAQEKKVSGDFIKYYDQLGIELCTSKIIDREGKMITYVPEQLISGDYNATMNVEEGLETDKFSFKVL